MQRWSWPTQWHRRSLVIATLQWENPDNGRGWQGSWQQLLERQAFQKWSAWFVGILKAFWRFWRCREWCLVADRAACYIHVYILHKFFCDWSVLFFYWTLSFTSPLFVNYRQLHILKFVTCEKSSQKEGTCEMLSWDLHMESIDFSFLRVCKHVECLVYWFFSYCWL